MEEEVSLINQVTFEYFELIEAFFNVAMQT
jgi:hypothetical protein